MVDDVEGPGDSDPLSERKVFPDAGAVFSFKPRTLTDVIEEIVVVLDTNVLLVPYTVSAQSLAEIRRTYSTLLQEGRLQIPGQVAREFARNRANKLGELFQKLTSKKSNTLSIESSTYPLLEKVEGYNDVIALEKEINGKLKAYKSALTTVLQTVKKWNWNDPVSLLYNELFGADSIVDIPIDDDEFSKDLANRTAAKRPPGYKDSKKASNSAGDLIIWRTILQIGRERKKPVLFVSGDAKSDWWHRSSGEALYPRYELIDEFRINSGDNEFFIVQFSEFLELFGAKPEAVQQVHQEEVQLSRETLSGAGRAHRGIASERAIRTWALGHFANSVLRRTLSDAPFEFLLLMPKRGQVGVMVKFLHNLDSPDLPQRINRFIRNAKLSIDAGEADESLICIVTPTYDDALKLSVAIQRIDIGYSRTSICTGHLARGTFELFMLSGPLASESS